MAESDACMLCAMQDFWHSSGFNQLRRNGRGWLEPTDDYLRLFLKRPELALVAESCAAERALHAALSASPSRAVAQGELQALGDADARENYSHFLRFRDALLEAGTLEGYYIGLFRKSAVDVPPLFVDLLAQAIVRSVLDGVDDPYEVRAGEILFRTQRVSTEEGQVLSADRDVIEMFAETGGFGSVGRLLAQSNTPLRSINMHVLNHENAQLYWLADERFTYVLDLTHGRTGLDALARVLEKWIAHFLGVVVMIAPQQKVEDEAWRWHVGLDAESTAILNDLYEGREVEPERMQRLVSLFRLEFADSGEMRADVAGKPVYLGLAINAGNVMKLKPQNLLINLPLGKSM